MDTEGAKRQTTTKIENCKQEFDMQLINLLDRLKKSKKEMSTADYMELSSDLELFSMAFSQISEELRLQESINKILNTLE